MSSPATLEGRSTEAVIDGTVLKPLLVVKLDGASGTPVTRLMGVLEIVLGSGTSVGVVALVGIAGAVVLANGAGAIPSLLIWRCLAPRRGCADVKPAKAKATVKIWVAETIFRISSLELVADVTSRRYFSQIERYLPQYSDDLQSMPYSSMPEVVYYARGICKRIDWGTDSPESSNLEN